MLFRFTSLEDKEIITASLFEKYVVAFKNDVIMSWNDAKKRVRSMG